MDISIEESLIMELKNECVQMNTYYWNSMLINEAEALAIAQKVAADSTMEVHSLEGRETSVCTLSTILI